MFSESLSDDVSANVSSTEMAVAFSRIGGSGVTVIVVVSSELKIGSRLVSFANSLEGSSEIVIVEASADDSDCGVDTASFASEESLRSARETCGHQDPEPWGTAG